MQRQIDHDTSNAAPDDSAGTLAFEALRTQALQLMSTTASTECVAALDAVVNKLAESEAVPVRGSVIGLLLQIAAWTYTSASSSRLGLIPADLAVARAQQLGDAMLIRKTLTFKGIICSDTGDVGRGIECLSEALEIAERLKDPEGLASVWNNLGSALQYAAQYRDAIACFSRSLHYSTNFQFPRCAFFAQSSLINVAQCHLSLQEHQKGLEAVETALATYKEPRGDEMVNRVLLEYVYTRLLLKTKQIPLAQERSWVAKGFAEKANSARARLAAENAIGLVEVATGSTDIGMTRLLKSLTLADEIKASRKDTLMALVMANEFLDKPDVALQFQLQLVEHTRHAIQDNALFHNALHLKWLAGNTDPTGPIELIQEHQVERLKRQSMEKTMLLNRMEMFERLAVTAELRDDSTGEHSYRVGRLACLLGEEMGLDPKFCELLDLAGRLHDIGKIGVPDNILLKPGKLSPEERLIMEKHTITGAELLARSEMPEMQMAEIIARHHHQKWDGTGYPMIDAPLSGEAIPLAARITALADVYDALTHRRPYKHAWTPQEALAEIEKLSGSHFDPTIAGLFLAMMRRLLVEHEDLDQLLGKASTESRFLQSRQKISQALHRRYLDPDFPQIG